MLVAVLILLIIIAFCVMPDDVTEALVDMTVWVFKTVLLLTVLVIVLAAIIAGFNTSLK